MPRPHEAEWTQYLALIERVSVIDSKLGIDLDTAAMNLKGAEVDEAQITGLRGVEMKGEIKTIHGPDLSFSLRMDQKAPTSSNVLNPAWKDCPCAWGRQAWEAALRLQERRAGSEEEHDPFKYGSGYSDLADGEEIHGLLLGLDGPCPWPAYVSLHAWISDQYLPDYGFDYIISQHNWRDPAGMTALAEVLDHDLAMAVNADREAKGLPLPVH